MSQESPASTSNSASKITSLSGRFHKVRWKDLPLEEKHAYILSNADHPVMVAANNAICANAKLRVSTIAAAHASCANYIRTSLISMLRRQNLVYRTGKSRILPYKFFESPGAWLSIRGFKMVGWPAGYKAHSIEKLSLGAGLAIAAMLVQKNIRIERADPQTVAMDTADDQQRTAGPLVPLSSIEVEVVANILRNGDFDEGHSPDFDDGVVSDAEEDPRCKRTRTGDGPLPVLNGSLPIPLDTRRQDIASLASVVLAFEKAVRRLDALSKGVSHNTPPSMTGH